MSHSDDFIAQLEDYLEVIDGVTPLPDRVRDAIRAELPSARQVRPRPGPLRVFTMLSTASAGARVGLAAAVVVAGVLGVAVLNNNRSAGVIGGVSTATPTPVPTTPTPAPSATAQPTTLNQAQYVACTATDTGRSCLAAGTYRLSGNTRWPVTVTVVVPAGWFEWEPGPSADALLVNGGPELQYAGSGWGILFGTVGDVSRDPCDATKGVIPAAQVNTPQKLTAVMAAWPRFKATATQPVTVDGHAGVRFQLTSTNKASCANSGTTFPWDTTQGVAVNTYPMLNSNGISDPGTFEIVDTGNGLLVIRMTDFPQTSPTEVDAGLQLDPIRHAADQAQLHAILSSIRLGAPQPSPSS